MRKSTLVAVLAIVLVLGFFTVDAIKDMESTGNQTVALVDSILAEV